MAKNLIRKYKLTIGNHEEILRAITKPFTGQNVTQDFITTTFSAMVIQNHQIVVTIDENAKGNSGQGNSNVIKVYNLSPEERAKIQADNYVHLEAGYEEAGDDLPLIFAGRVLKTSITKESSGDIVTSIVCTSTPAALSSVTVSGTIEEDTLYRDAIRRLLVIVQGYGVPLGDYDLYSESAAVTGIRTKALPNGYTYEGKLLDVLNSLCREAGYRVYMSAGKIYVRPRQILGGTPLEYIRVVITPELVKGISAPAKDTVGATAKDSKTKKSGAKITTFLNGYITKDKLIELRGFDEVSGVTDGDYKIDSLKYDLNYEQGNWDLELNLLSIGGK